MNIEFNNPEVRSSGERKSKLLQVNSKLYDFLEAYRNNIIKYSNCLVSDKRMDYHIQLLYPFEQDNISIYLKRVKYLQNRYIDVSDIKNYGFMGKAFILKTSSIYGYGETHITIAYFNTHYKHVPDILMLLKLNPINFTLHDKSNIQIYHHYSLNKKDNEDTTELTETDNSKELTETDNSNESNNKEENKKENKDFEII